MRNQEKRDTVFHNVTQSLSTVSEDMNVCLIQREKLQLHESE